MPQPAVAGADPRTAQLTVSGSAQALLSGGKSQARASLGVIITSLSTNTVAVYLGPSGVTTANGHALLPGTSISLPFDDPARIFAICASTSPVITFMY